MAVVPFIIPESTCDTMKLNVTKQAIVEAIKLIDENPELLNGRSSSTYDLLYKGRRYPPILVLSEANKLVGGDELKHNDFKNVHEAFELLNSLDFEVRAKENMSLKDRLLRLSKIYDEDRKQKFNRGLESFQIICKEIPAIIQGKLKKLDLLIQGSIGQGNFANYPWIAIFNPKASTGATNGYYVVLLISDDLERVYLTLNQGSTLQSKEDQLKNTNHVFGILKEVSGFTKGRLPENGLVRRFANNAGNKTGKKYESTNLFYREYSINNFHENDFYEHLNILLDAYDRCALSPPRDKSMINAGTEFSTELLTQDFLAANLNFTLKFTQRFVASLLTKPFLLLSGLSGSGKTKIAQGFVQWISQSSIQYKVVPVGADWTNREPLIGYPNGLDPNLYTTPDNGVLQLIIEASQNSALPYFLILDEMNLSHVERYFADFLSIMESNDTIKLYTGKERTSADGRVIPFELGWPSNLFIIGTVNIDETTYMFSPKVLDRANVMEFRLTNEDLNTYLTKPSKPNLDALVGRGSLMAASFLEMARSNDLVILKDVSNVLSEFFLELSSVGAEFGYRTANEIVTLITRLGKLDPSLSNDEKIDIAVMQKLLPKLHGSRSKIVKVLESILKICLLNGDLFKIEDLYTRKFEDTEIRYPISFEKISRMYANVMVNGFTSYAEA